MTDISSTLDLLMSKKTNAREAKKIRNSIIKEFKNSAKKIKELEENVSFLATRAFCDVPTC